MEHMDIIQVATGLISIPPNGWYVYQHITNDESLPFYIGIGKKKNYSRAKTKFDRNQFWSNIVNKHGFKHIILYENISYEEACKLEIELIAKYGRRDLGTGCLCNLTNGGEGKSGISEEERLVRSNRFSGENNPNYGKKMSDVQKQKISNTLKENKIIPPNWHNTEVADLIKAKISKSLTGKPTSDNKRLKLSQCNSGELNNSSKITEDIARSIKIFLKDGVSVKTISEKLYISKRIIENIKYNKTWKHVII
jgi:hypothetical protein